MFLFDKCVMSEIVSYVSSIYVPTKYLFVLNYFHPTNCDMPGATLPV